MKDLSIVIPASNPNGIFINKTIESILANIRGNTEVIVVYNGAWPDPGIPAHELVTVVHYSEKIGQRAATNIGVRLSKAKYIMKCDAHCAFDEGFDVKMMQEMHDDWTMVPLMKNLHAFDWVCQKCGNRWYQGPTPTHCLLADGKTLNQKCNSTQFDRDILWKAKDSPNSVSYCFDSTPHFQYFGEYSKRPEGKGDVSETMSIQGSCFMLTREKYWELDICDESFGSWGSQGIEVACKTWLSGGKVMVNKKTWYAHMFRTQGGDFSFSHPISAAEVKFAKSKAQDLFFNDNWPLQKRPLFWLVEKFWPVKGWTEEDLKKLKENKFKFKGSNVAAKTEESEPVEEQSAKTASQKGIIYYTDNQLKLKIAVRVQRQLAKIAERKNMPIVSASLKPMDFGKNVYLPLKREVLTMFKQILAALEASEADIVFFCEHDVLYHPSHFDFTPPKKKVWYYNENVWKLDTKTGHALHYDCRQVSGIAVYRKTAIKHYKKRVEMVEKHGFSLSMGYEPGTHSRKERVDDSTSRGWKSEFPNIDIRHDNNLSPSRWKKEEFRNQKYTKGWVESDAEIPGWGKTEEWKEKFS